MRYYLLLLLFLLFSVIVIIFVVLKSLKVFILPNMVEIKCKQYIPHSVFSSWCSTPLLESYLKSIGGPRRRPRDQRNLGENLLRKIKAFV